MARRFQVVGYDGYGNIVGIPAAFGGGSPGLNMGQGLQKIFNQGGGANAFLPQVAPAPMPDWGGRGIAPGVISPDEGLVPIPLLPDAQGGIFTGVAGSANVITFVGQTQKPFRAERLLVSVARTGASATGRVLGQVFVGTDLQQAEVGNLDLEVLGSPTAFGTRMTMTPCGPGVQIRIPTVLSGNPTAPDTIFVSMQLLGRIVH